MYSTEIVESIIKRDDKTAWMEGLEARGCVCTLWKYLLCRILFYPVERRPLVASPCFSQVVKYRILSGIHFPCPFLSFKGTLLLCELRDLWGWRKDELQKVCQGMEELSVGLMSTLSCTKSWVSVRRWTTIHSRYVQLLFPFVILITKINAQYQPDEKTQ